MVVGELSLGGSVRHTNGILPMVSVARQRGLKRVYVPARDAAEAALVDGLEVYPVANLAAMLDHLNGVSKLSRYELPPRPADEEVVYPVDMADVKGQEHVKRAVEICAAGSHNALGLWTTIQLALCAAGGPGRCAGQPGGRFTQSGGVPPVNTRASGRTTTGRGTRFQPGGFVTSRQGT